MRYALVAITFALAIGGCATARRGPAAQNTALSQLGSCETRVISLPGAELVVNANADGTLAAVRLIRAAGHAARYEALATVHRAFGPAHPDAGLVARQSKWGLTTWTDPCGRPVTLTSPARTPSVTRR